LDSHKWLWAYALVGGKQQCVDNGCFTDQWDGQWIGELYGGDQYGHNFTAGHSDNRFKDPHGKRGAFLHLQSQSYEQSQRYAGGRFREV